MKLSFILATLTAIASNAAATPVETTAQNECGPKWDWCDNLDEIRCECNGGHRVRTHRFARFAFQSSIIVKSARLTITKLKCTQIWLDSGVSTSSFEDLREGMMSTRSNLGADTFVVVKFWNPVENCPKHGTKLQCIDGECVGP